MRTQLTSCRRGMTLTELIVALVVLAIVGNALLGATIAMQRITRQQNETAAVRGSLRSGLLLLQDELVELSPGDIWARSERSIGYRAMQGIGETCALSTSTVVLRTSSYAGLHNPTAGRDGLLLYLDGDASQTADDRWILVTFSAVTAATCPNGDSGWALTVSLSADDSTDALVPGPIRTFESMEIGQVQDDGQEWLGIRSLGLGESSLVPVTGPLAAEGLRFVYLDGNDVPTGAASEIRTIVATLRARSERPAGVNSAGLVIPTDSLTLRVRLRN